MASGFIAAGHPPHLGITMVFGPPVTGHPLTSGVNATMHADAPMSPAHRGHESFSMRAGRRGHSPVSPVSPVRFAHSFLIKDQV